ncbi:hypothetical protein POTOM_025769 [Populus tomentosa]|uniref:Protein kinase domain-containing protein n=1 Tax=Populus tomentosa TaxID=118781 RepID=A0A8X7ZIL2_POPTO|nr:hypothetical protein POTOM_025769 [Populus tomentosa]
MAYGNKLGKYQVGRTIGEGTFAKVKLAVDTTNGNQVAIKIMDKNMVMQSDLKNQVQREIRTMKLLHHPNIVRIHEVIGTKTKIFMVMEYISGGQLADKLVRIIQVAASAIPRVSVSLDISNPVRTLFTQSYAKKLNESEARTIFHQLIDAVDYCHTRGVYHRDLKPENLLLDSKGNLKVSDFGLSAFHKPASMLTTACGSPCYVAPELIANKGYHGEAADVWSCGIILFELLSGYLPFDERNLIMLYKKISTAEYTCPLWFTKSQRKLISRILDPNPRKRITIPEIIEDEWFRIDYVPSCGYESDEKILLDDVNAAFDADEEDRKQKTRLGSEHSVHETIRKIEVAAMDVSLSVERMKNSKMKMNQKLKMKRCTRSYYDLSAEVIEVAPMNCVVEISKSVGELRLYKEFCKSLSSLLTKKSDVSLQTQGSEKTSSNKSTQEIKSCEEQIEKETDVLQGYSTS